MRLATLFAFVLLVGLSSCKSKSAFEFNEKIIKIERSLANDVNQTEDRVGKFFQDQQYDSAAAVSQRMEGLVDAKLKEVEALDVPNVKEGDNLKKAAVRYFSYMKSVYTAYKSFSTQTTDEARETERKNLLKVSEQRNEAIADIQSAQQKFAAANGFKIENK